MTKEECLAIEGLTNKQRTVVTRLFWAANKNNKECRLEKATNAEEVLAIINATFRKAPETTVVKQSVNLNSLSIEELEELLNKIPAIIEQKKAEKLAEIDAEIAKLKELKEALK